MLKALLARLKQGHRTIKYPGIEPQLPDRYRGRPTVDVSQCVKCSDCEKACPTGAIQKRNDSRTGAGQPSFDLGRCLFCTDCMKACPAKSIQFTRDFRLAARTREDLVTCDQAIRRVADLEGESRRLFGRSLKLRQVSAGGCNACEQDVNVLNTVVFDLGRFGIQFVASPRHADGLLITGPVTRNMRQALLKTYEAVPSPKIVIAVGACAISGGAFAGQPEVNDGASALLPVDLYVPGCPPHPLTVLDGLLQFLGKI